MSDFAHNEGSVDYVVQIASEELPDNPSERIERLESYHARLTALVRDHKKRMPKLKVLRLLAALFPFDMTRIVGAAKLRKTLRRLGVAIPTKASPVRMNRILLDHISDVIGPCGDQIDDAVERSMFAWTHRASQEETARALQRCYGRRTGLVLNLIFRTCSLCLKWSRMSICSPPMVTLSKVRFRICASAAPQSTSRSPKMLGAAISIS